MVFITDPPSEYHEIVDSLAGELPSIPLIMNDLMKIISDSNAALFAIRDILKNDKSIFSKILKFANNLEMRQGSAERITCISIAIQRLGLEKVKKIALNTSVFEIFKELENNSGFNLEEFWKHSCGVAIASESLAEMFELKHCDQAYSCGLLHDLGKVAKIKFSLKRFLREIRHTSRYNCSLDTTEKKLNTIGHDKLGALIIKKWSISPVIECTTRWHHTLNKEKRLELEDPNLHKLTDIIILANHIIKELNFGNSGCSIKFQLDSDFLRRRKIDGQEFEKCKEVVLDALDGEAEHLALFSKE